MRNRTWIGLGALLLAALLAGCGRGGGGGGGGGGGPVPFTGEAYAGIWTGTFSDQFGDYTVALEVRAVPRVVPDDPERVEVVWGAESLGLEILDGEIVELADGRLHLEYGAYDPADGRFVDAVTGTLVIDGSGDYMEGSFGTSSGTSGDCSFVRSEGFRPSFVAAVFTMEFSDPGTREVFYYGEMALDFSGNLILGQGSFLTDDVEGEIDPDANIWPILDAYIDLVDYEVGFYEGEIFFADPDDTIYVSGYLGLDFYVYAGIFEDIQGAGLFTFYPED